MNVSALRTEIETALTPKFQVSFCLKNKPVPAFVHSGIPRIDPPGGTLSEIYGPASSGKTGMLFAALSLATRLSE